MAATNAFTRLLRNLRQGLSQVLLRFPATLLYAVLFGACFVVANHALGLAPAVERILGRIELALGIAMPLSAAATLLVERWKGDPADEANRIPLPRALAQAAVAVLAALYGLLLTTGFRGMDGSVVPARALGFGLAAVLLFVALPRLPARPGFVEEQIRIFYRLFATVVFTVVLCGGLCGIVGAADLLFSLHVEGKVYGDVVIASWALFAPAFFLAGAPRPDRDVPEREYPAFMRVLALYILAPLTLAYAALLVVYLLKIAFTLTMPSNQVFNLVFWYAAVILLLSTALLPLRARSRAADLYARWMPFVLLPLEAMMLLSLGIRVAAYGFTEVRWIGLLAGLWVVGATTLLAVRSRRPLRMPALLPATLAVVAVLAVFGPLSAFSIAKASMNARFDALLAKYDVLKDGKLAVPYDSAPKPAFSAEDRATLDGIAQRFAQDYGLAALRALPADEAQAAAALAAVGLSSDGTQQTPDGAAVDVVFGTLDQSGAIPVSGYDVAIPVSAWVERASTPAGTPAAVGWSVTTGDPGLSIAVWKDGERTGSLDLSAYVLGLLAAHPDAVGAKNLYSFDQLAASFGPSGSFRYVPRTVSAQLRPLDGGGYEVLALTLDGTVLVRNVR